MSTIKKTIFEWAETFQEDIQGGASQSDIIQMLEDYKKEQCDELLEQRNDLLKALKEVLNIIETSDSWWMDLPERGGFDKDKIKKAISKTESKT